ncbi:MAG: hypothetical protein ACTHM1_01340 [Solirubrobacteraceae bacterium]
MGFVNYDTLYGLVWGQQLTHGEMPQYGIAFAPTPHPLVELLGLALTPLGAKATAALTVALAFLGLSALGWVLYRLGSEWFGHAAGALAAAVLLTRVPILSYGVRAYVDVPYTLLVLLALLAVTRRRRAGAPVLALLCLAGLLRPEAWVFSGAYWVYLAAESRSARRTSRDDALTPIQLARLGLLALAAPALWLLSDLLVTGDPLWSLTNTRTMAHTLHRTTGASNVPEYIPRRIGEILRPAGLAGAAIGGALALLWVRGRARLGAVAGVLAVAAFALTATFGLPIDTRYAFLSAAILSVFCGAGAFGWLTLAKTHRWRRAWMALGSLVFVALVASLPGQLRSVHGELAKLGRQQQIQDDLVAFASRGTLSVRCGPVGVPSHAPIPLLALYLKAAPAQIVTAQGEQLSQGSFVDPASRQVEEEYVLLAQRNTLPVSIPPGFNEAAANSSWLLFEHCA